jgi:MFS family permease
VIQSRRAILALLTGLNLVNYIDRFLVMAVSPKIQESLGLGNAEVGWVASVFMLGYFATSPIFGRLGDRFPRKGLIAAGVVVWSIATFASGLAGSLASLLLARVAVGVGEASYATLSPTIIDEIAPEGAKNRYLAIFYVAIPVGSALGFLLGGELERSFGWRSAFFIAGGPGVLLALVTLLIREPARVAGAGAAATSRAAYAELWRSRAYVLTVAGYVAQTFALGGFTAWAAHYLYRKMCLDLHEADRLFGTVTVVTGLAGTALGGWLTDRWPGADRAAAYLRVCAWSSIVAAPFALASLMVSSSWGFFVALGLCELAVFASVAPTNAAILETVPGEVRATAMAASIFAIHLFGDLISPPLIGRVTDAYGDVAAQCSGGRGLTIGMYLLPAALAVSAVAWWIGSRPRAPAAGAS